MAKIRSGEKPHRSVETSKAKGKSEVAKSAKAVETKKADKAKDSAFPRAAWKDTNKLKGEITRTKDRLGLNEHPRGRHTKIDKDPVIGGRPSRPPIVARYGLIMPTPTPEQPPILARYGLPAPGGGGGGVKPPTPRPPIVARYGVIMPKPDQPTPPPPRPPIVARYGLIMPKPDQPAPRPPIVARYGLIMPRPGVQTEPRQGITHR